MANCQVCLNTPSKYKCPTCSLPYCSVVCYKKHKESPCSPPSAAGPETETKRVSNIKVPEEDDDTRLTGEQLTQLEESIDVKDMISNPDVREMLKAIDAAPNPEAAYDEAVARNPMFQEFVSKTLDAVIDRPQSD